VQALLLRNGRTGGAPVRNQFAAILKGLLRCVPCGCAMTPAHTTKGAKRYRYYTCVNGGRIYVTLTPDISLARRVPLV
jgi:site-specific DNA recombinase